MEAMPEVIVPAPKPSFFINRNFGLLWIGQAISDIGNMIYFVTLSLWIATIIAKDLSWAPAAVSGVMIAAALPSLTLGPFAGVFVDRWDRRLTMMRMDMIRAVLILLLIPLTGLMPLPFVSRPLPILWQLGAIYAVVLAASICGEFFSPARFTILSEILTEAQRPQASAMEQSSSSIVKILGPFLAAPLLFVVGIHWALIVNALSFVVSFVAISLVRVPHESREGSEQAPNFLRELKEGISFYRENHLMLTIFLSVLIITLGMGALDALLVFFFQKHLHAPVSLFGTLPMAIGAGSILGALLAGLLVRRLGSVRVYWLSLYIIGVLLMFFALQSTLWPALLLLFLVGLPLGALNTALGPLLMHIIPHNIMGRVESVFNTSQTLCSLISISLAGLLATLFVTFHANLFTIAFDTYGTIYVAIGLLFILGAFYAMLNLRGLKLDESA